MSNYIAARSGAKRKADWRDDAACRGDGNDHWFPLSSNATAVASAKRGCFACPVIFECAQYALRSRLDDGVWGGLSEAQRRTLTKNHRAMEFDSLDRVRALVLRALQPEINPINTLRDLWEDRTHSLANGHIGWSGQSGSFTFRGAVYTPKQLAFLLDRGHKASGIVRRTCQVVECVHPLHMEDSAERQQRIDAERAAVARAAAQVEYPADELAS